MELVCCYFSNMFFLRQLGFYDLFVSGVCFAGPLGMIPRAFWHY
jgi:hypothetical protein